MRESKFSDRGFVLAVLLAILGLFAGVAYSMIDDEPRQSSVFLLLENARR